MPSKKELIGLSIAGFIGVVFFLFLYSEILNPTYDQWLLDTSADPTQYYIGWVMYRHSDWSFPIGLAKNYGYPFGMPISYTDSIPLLAIIFKLFRNWLPEKFQYFGLWLLICFILQSIFGYLLIKRFTGKQIIAIIGSILFVLSPIMLFRPFALGGQWLILASLWLILKKHKTIQWWQWSLLSLLSLLVHPYLFFMVFFLMLVDLVNLVAIDQQVKIKFILLFLIVEIIFIFLVAYSLGLLMLGQASASGYGQFSMNLNSLINPYGHWSIFIPELPIRDYQIEGFNYLGIGIIFLFLISLYSSFKNKDIYKIFKKSWPVLLICIILTLLAVTNIVVFNTTELINIRLPQIVTNDIMGIFRASGRLFWPVFYFILVFSFYILKINKPKKALLILIIALSLQTLDLTVKLEEIRSDFKNKSWDNRIDSKPWQDLAKGYQHISFLPVIPHKNYVSFILYAAENNMTVNNGYFARSFKKLDDYIGKEINEAKAGNFKSDTIYVFSREVNSFTQNIDFEKHLLASIDKTFVLFPYFKENHLPDDYLDFEVDIK